MAIKLPPNWCKVTLNFCRECFNLSEIFSFLSLNMDFVIASSADPDEMTHRVAFHLGFPCSIKYPISGFWYTKGIQRVYKGLTSLIFGYKSCHVLQRIKFVIALIVEGCHHFCQMMSGFREDSNSSLICQRSRPLAAMFLRNQVCFICFVVGHRGNIPAKLYSILTIGSRGYVKSLL